MQKSPYEAVVWNQDILDKLRVFTYLKKECINRNGWVPKEN